MIHFRKNVRIIHHSPVTLLQFYNYLNEWAEPEYFSFQILALSFHGCPGHIFIGDVRISLEEIGDIINARGRGRMIFFSSCETLNIRSERIQKFLAQTKLTRISGYDDEISITGAKNNDQFALTRLICEARFLKR
jgi:hypothetical protein